MTLNRLGDLAQTFALRHQNTRLKQDIQNLNQELVTGQAADLTKHLGGSFARLSSIERDLRVLDGYAVSLSEAKNFTDLMQTRLGQINDITSEFARTLIASESSKAAASANTVAADAGQQFRTVVSMLNSQAAGRSLFAGDTTDSAALLDADTLLAEIETVVAGSASLADIETALDTWFADPLGFDTFAYTGSTTDLAPLRVSENAEVSIGLRADNKALKDTMKALAKAAVSTSAGVTLTADERSTLFLRSGEDLLTAEAGLVTIQARIGIAQEQIEGWSVRNQTEKSGLMTAKGALVSIDPYQAATELEAAQFQLESLYTVTVRLSQLSLVNFLR